MLDEFVVSEVADHLLHNIFHWEEFGLTPQVAHEDLNAAQHAVLRAIACPGYVPHRVANECCATETPSRQEGMQAELHRTGGTIIHLFGWWVEPKKGLFCDLWAKPVGIWAESNLTEPTGV